MAQDGSPIEKRRPILNAAWSIGLACIVLAPLDMRASKRFIWPSMKAMGDGRRIRALAALPILTAGCATLPATGVHLDADGPNVVYAADGTEIMSADEGGLRIAVAHAFQQQGTIALRVEVENLRDETVIVDPRQMYYRTCPLFHSGPNDGDCTPAAEVMDQEGVLDALERDRVREQPDETAAAVVGTVLLLLAAVAVAKVAERALGRYQPPGDTALLFHDDNGTSRERVAAARELERQNLATRALRLTRLPPAQGVAGLVYVPIDPGARSLRLFMSIAGQQFRFPFQQAVRAPR
jgi:hypothetical protein